jgi:hypothetical protein
MFSLKMIVLLYSDTNYVLGFLLNAEFQYTVTDCITWSANHGHCVNHSCVCEATFVGKIYKFGICQDQCGFMESKG